MRLMDNKIDNMIVITLPERFHNEQATSIGVKLEEILIESCSVILDFSNVSYIDSTGLTVLMTANKVAKARSVKLNLRCMNVKVRTLFAMTCLDQVFTIE